jgi:hypothetical protein
MLECAVFLATTPEQVLYGYGPLGVGVVVLTFAVMKMFNIIMKDRDRAISDREAMVQDVFTKVLPALTRSNDILEKQRDLHNEVLEVVRSAVTAAQENGRVLERVEWLLTHGRPDKTGGSG